MSIILLVEYRFDKKLPKREVGKNEKRKTATG